METVSRGLVEVINLFQQYGALPFEWTPKGELRVMLLTTRGRKRWMIPKGWPIHGLEPHDSAAQEAFEEAGLVGHIYPVAIGSFKYLKRLRLGLRVKCTVEVFPLHVDHQRQFWLEQGERATRWFSIKKAANLVSEPELRKILLHFEEKSSTLPIRSKTSEVPI